MFLIASSIGRTTETDINNEAKKFFNQSSNLNAQIFLNSLLPKEGIDVTVSAAVTSALLHGSILWKDELTPSGLAVSVLTSQDVIRPNMLEGGIVLDFSTRHKMSEFSIEKLTKTQVIYPKDINDMIERFKGLHILAKLFFGERSYLERGLDSFILKCDKHKQFLRIKLHLDKLFIAKLMYAIDKSIFFWLKECLRASNVDQTDLELTCLSDIF